MGADCSILFDNSTSTEKSYEVLMTEPSFEVRKYSSSVIAEINVEVIGVEAGIAILNNYLGENGRPMITPRMNMPKTVPVIVSQLFGTVKDESNPLRPIVVYNSKALQILCYLPEYTDIESAPKPVDPAILLKLLPSRLVAIRKFSHDKSSNEHVAEETAELIEDMMKKNLYPRAFDPKQVFFEFAENEIWVPLNERLDGVVFHFAKHIPQIDYSKHSLYREADTEDDNDDNDGVEYLYYYETEEERLACMQQQEQIVWRIPILLNKSNDEDL